MACQSLFNIHNYSLTSLQTIANQEPPPYLVMPKEYVPWKKETNQRAKYEPLARQLQSDSSQGSTSKPNPNPKSKKCKLVAKDYKVDEREVDYLKLCELCERYPLPEFGGEEARMLVAQQLQAAIEDVNGAREDWHGINLLVHTIQHNLPHPYDRFIKFKPKAKINEEDAKSRIGDASLNESDPRHPERSPAEIISKFLNFRGSGKVESEGRVEHLIGALLTGVLAGNGMDDMRWVYFLASQQIYNPI
jgi:hypothetical protein